MGSSFFKTGSPAKMGGISTSPMSANMRASSYGTHGAAIGAQKALAGAQAANKEAEAARAKPLKGSAAYPKGPKI